MSRRHARTTGAIPADELSFFTEWLHEQGYSFPKLAPNPYEVMRATHHSDPNVVRPLIGYRSDRNPGIIRIADDGSDALYRFNTFRT